MTSNNDPDKKIEKIESTEDEELIELKEESIDVSQDDEEIIELTEAVDESDVEIITEGIVPQAPESEQDPEIIELEEETFDVSQDDEEIIDLMDAADEPEVEDEKEAVVAQEAESSEEIITLTETMSEPPREIEEIGEPLHITANTSDESDDFVDSLGMELDAKEDISEDVLESEKVSDVQMEAALERVIKNMFYEKIDGILVEVIEKTVTREIEKLKSLLLQDGSGNEK